MGKAGFSWSWKRAVGISALKGKISRNIGIPLTRSGRQRKLGRMVERFGLGLLLADGDETTEERTPRQIATRRLEPRVLKPHYMESFWRFALRRLAGLLVFLVSVLLAIVAVSWVMDGKSWISGSVLMFAVPGCVGLLASVRLMRARKRSDAPMATAAQLATIDELHGYLPRQITAEEAAKVIEFLGPYRFDCPFCGAKCKTTNVMCGACRQRLDAVRVPIFLPK